MARPHWRHLSHLAFLIETILLPVAVLAGNGTIAAKPAERPNFVFILADDWGLGDVGAYNTLLANGIDKPATPNLDKIAAEGTIYTDFHTLGAECSPSRASWMTGRSPSDKAVKIHLVIGSHATNVQKGCADYLNTSTPTVTSVMHSVGYATGHFGKWHLGDTQPNTTSGDLGAPTPHSYGIDTYRCYVCNTDSANETYPFADEWFPSNSSRMIVDDTVAFITSALQARKPFYVNAWFHISHAPLKPTNEQMQAYANFMAPGGGDPGALCNSESKFGGSTCPSLIFRASQFEADAQIGRLMSSLKTLGVDSNTMVIFSGDNGPEDPHIYTNAVGDPGPFRGRKRSLYDGGTHMALLARWPSMIPAGQVSSAQLMSADWLPTVASLAGATDALKAAQARIPSAAIGVDRSGDFVPSAGPPPSRTIPIMFDYRADGYGACWNQAPRLAILTPEYKLLMNPDESRLELYNRSFHSDPFEAGSIAILPYNAQLIDTLKTQLMSWVETLDPIKPGSMGAKSLHLGCYLYKGPKSTPDHFPEAFRLSINDDPVEIYRV